MTYAEMSQKAKPESASKLAHVLLRIYEADRTENCGMVCGEAVLSHSFSEEARDALEAAGVLVSPTS